MVASGERRERRGCAHQGVRRHRRARARGRERAAPSTEPTGPLIDIADSVVGVDVVMGDHNDLQVNAVRPNGVLVTENRGKGIRVHARPASSWTTDEDGRLQDGGLPQAVEHRGHARSGASRRTSTTLNAQLAPIFNTGDRRRRRVAIPRADSCGSGGRAAVRVARSATSSPTRCGRPTRPTSRSRTRAACAPTSRVRRPDIAGDFCPAFTPPPFPITRGQVLAVLPFGNIVVTLQVNGAELKTMLENGVSRHAGRQRPLPAGLRAVLHVQHLRTRPGAASLGAVRQAADGTLHRGASRPDGGLDVHDRRERLHGQRRRRLPELRQPHAPRRTSWTRSRPTTSRRTRRSARRSRAASSARRAARLSAR